MNVRNVRPQVTPGHAAQWRVLPRTTVNRLHNGRARAALWLLVTGALAVRELAHLWVALGR